MLIARCCAVLDGHVDPELAIALGGASAPPVLAGQAGGIDGYWPRTWAMRTFLHVPSTRAECAALGAASDPHWRVREMATRVIAAQRMDGAAVEAALEILLGDESRRVRTAAGRALR